MRLYRLAAEERGMKQIAGVMGDPELVLLQTSLANVPDRASLAQIQRLIRKRDLVTKIESGSGYGFRLRGSKMTLLRIARIGRVSAIVAVVATCAAGAWAEAPESKRLARAKDLIADEQWTLAIVELRAATADAKEPRRDEALYWLANSLNQSGDQASAVEAISRLERDFPKSMWVRPARSLRIEIAVRLNRNDVLWWTAMPRPQPWPQASAASPSPDQAPRAPKPPAAPAPPAPSFWFADKVRPGCGSAYPGARRPDEERRRTRGADAGRDCVRERESRSREPSRLHAGAVVFT